MVLFGTVADAEIETEVQSWRSPIARLYSLVIGTTAAPLNGSFTDCRLVECSFGKKHYSQPKMYLHSDLKRISFVNLK